MTDAEFVTEGTALMRQNIDHAIKARGFCILGLSGGSTPKPIYEALGRAAETPSSPIDWSKVWVFLVDDRYIRADDPNSNQFLLRSTLLKNATIPESQIIFPDTTLPLPECVKLYGQHLNDLLKKGPPDLVTLGMGDDGHIASLFPPLGDDAFGSACAIHTTT
ncbi:6-phosphogluconolactonase, partial [Candidatus Peribacteria bacterium]|nr:6-phosphogluconolactonase [Candidatus Peribacteria bacterium]